MTERKFFRTVIRFEVLSDEPLGEMSLEDIHNFTHTGHGSGMFLETTDQAQVMRLLEAQSSDPMFLNNRESLDQCPECEAQVPGGYDNTKHLPGIGTDMVPFVCEECGHSWKEDYYALNLNEEKPAPEGCKHSSFSFDRAERDDKGQIIHVHCDECGASGSTRALEEDILWPQDDDEPEDAGPIKLVPSDERPSAHVVTLLLQALKDARAGNFLGIALTGTGKDGTHLTAHSVKDAHLGNLLLALKVQERKLIDIVDPNRG